LSLIRYVGIVLCVGAVFGAAACSNNANRGVTATVGVDTGVALSTAGSLTSLLTSQTLGLGATVENPSNDAGVSWTLTGVGSLEDLTNSTATYAAPATVTGATTALITATSIANPTQYASVALIVLGTPVINPLTLFPANVNVPYQTPVSAAGGDAPFTWEILSGALPAGLVLNGSTAAATYIEGTPTTAGTSTFTLQGTDSLSRVAKVTLTLTVKPQTACLLAGRYTFLFSGFRGGAAATHTGAILIDSNGNITGEQDYKDPHVTNVAEPLTSGTCINRETNSGVLTLNAASGQLVYNFAATPPDANGVIHSARLQLISSGSDSGSGQLELQDLTGITATPPSGDFAFGLFGAETDGTHFGTAGRFTSSSKGDLSAGEIDSNGPTVLQAQALTGTISAPDANGRGTLSLLAGGQTTTLAYYLVNTGKMFMIDVDPTTGTGTTRYAGQMTTQVGNAGAIAFDSSALVPPSVVSLYGKDGNIEPVTDVELGRLSAANAGAGTVDMLLDTSDMDIDASATLYAAQKYTMAANGRGTLDLVNTSTSRTFVLYLDGAADGYILEQNGVAGSVGFLEAQYQGPYPNPPVTGIFPATLNNGFVGGTEYPTAPGPITLDALVFLNYDALSSNFLNGSFAIDPLTGRGLGTVTESGVGSQAAVIYVVSTTKMEMLRFGTRAVDGTLEALIQ
jgi:hypothetical protein